MQPAERSRALAVGDHEAFETHEDITRYFLPASAVIVFFALLGWHQPSLVTSIYLLMATLVMTAPITELVTGHDLSHLTINSLPHTLVALEILGVTLYPFAGRRLAPDVRPGSRPGRRSVGGSAACCSG